MGIKCNFYEKYATLECYVEPKYTVDFSSIKAKRFKQKSRLFIPKTMWQLRTFKQTLFNLLKIVIHHHNHGNIQNGVTDHILTFIFKLKLVKIKILKWVPQANNNSLGHL